MSISLWKCTLSIVTVHFINVSIGNKLKYGRQMDFLACFDGDKITKFAYKLGTTTFNLLRSVMTKRKI